MKRTLIGFIALTLLAAYAGANEGEVFDRLDDNADGQLTTDEIDKSHSRLFRRLLRLGDENNDGQISKAEFIAETTKVLEAASRPANGSFSPNRRPNFNLQQFFTRLDRNGDKKLSKEEAPERMRANFDRLDQNSDGFIDGAELRRLAEAIRDRANANRKPMRD